MGIKHYSIHGCYCCSQCHWWVDGGYTTGDEIQLSQDEIKKLVKENDHYRAIIETQIHMIKNGVLIL